LRVVRSYNVNAVSVDTAAQAIGGAVSTVRICGTVDCYVRNGAAATATALFLPAGWPETYTVAGGDVLHALRAGSTDGVLNIAELSN